MVKWAVENCRGELGENFIKCLIVSFNIQNIVNFVMDVSVEFSVIGLHIIIVVK